MHKLLIAAAVGQVVLCAACVLGAEVSISVNPKRVLGRVDEKIYGHFLEHIFHSVNGGLWGELVWDRSFEGGGGAPAQWRLEQGVLSQTGGGTNVRQVFGDARWTDYEFTLEAQKTGGDEGFLILFRVLDAKQFYWANLGGWGNQRHGLERGDKDKDRWGGVGPHPDGRIEQGKWYPIRVRCEGPHFQVWLGDDKVIDFTDDSGKAHLAGRVGVGTWSTQARFRRLKVTALDGTALYEGLPKVEAAPPTPHGWTGYGPGKVTAVRQQMFNGDVCQLIEAEGGETGLAQAPFAVRKGETYHGSVWARGEAAEGMAVRLRDGRKVLAEKALDKPDGKWKEYAFDLKARAAADDALLEVGVCGQAKVWLDQVSLMSESARRTGGFRPDLLKAVADLKPPIIRWPGGCFASLYRWRDGIGPQFQRIKYPRSIWDDVDVNSYGTDEFVAMCRAVGAEPLIVVNIGMHDDRAKRPEYLKEACDWVEYCNGPATSKWGKLRADNGHPEPYGVKYWEIDNEVWKLTPDDYASVVREFVPAMKKVDPSIIVAACGSGQLGRNWGEGDLRVIAECADLIDYLSVHHYEGADRFAGGPAAEEAFLRQRADLIAKSANPKVKLYVSEWNAQSTDWRTGLYCGGLLNVFERCGDFVGMAGPALFLRHTSATSWDNAFINFDHRTWFPAPNYVVMKLWRDHYAPDRIELAGDLGGLNAVATASADGATVYLKAVNPTDRPVEVALKIEGGFAPKRASLALVAPDSLSARNTLDAPDAVAVAEGKVARDGDTVRFTLPRWCAAVVTIGR